MLKKNNELRKGGYLKSFYKDIMKVAFFVCILFLLFFIIHTKLQKSIELQVPVSYTHLDVYKRQIIWRSSI